MSAAAQFCSAFRTPAMPAPPAPVTGAPLNARRRSHLPRITSVACGVARGVRLRSAG